MIHGGVEAGPNAVLADARVIRGRASAVAMSRACLAIAASGDGTTPFAAWA